MSFFERKSRLKSQNMKNISVLFALLLTSVLSLNGQNASINGQIFDNKNQTIIGANVALLSTKDSTIISGTTTNMNGYFNLELKQRIPILIRITFIGFQEIYIAKEWSNRPINLGKITLLEKAMNLDAVEIVAQATPVIQSGDTTQINASAFKTNPDANIEDLITKMPGITIQDGKVQAHGENVQKVLVDGQEFFGDDANTILKNLPAEVVDKIEIFDKKSDQTEASGFDDGNTIKTINIVTKVEFRNGTFGKAYAGYGFDNKWKAGMNLNFFKEKRRFAILLNSNNVNEQNFSSEDLLGVMSSTKSSGGSKRGGKGGGGQPNDAGNFLVNQKNGITTTQALGVNYVNQWKNINFSGSYFINYSDNLANENLFRYYATSVNEGFTYEEQQESNSKNLNHRLNLRIDWKIDSLNSILFQPRVSFQQNNAASNMDGKNQIISLLQSITNNDFKSNLTGANISAPILYRHTFKKKGRSFSLSLTPSYNQNRGDNYLNTFAEFYSDTTTIELLDQFSNRNMQGVSISSNASYTEPVGKLGMLNFNYRTNYTYNKSEKETFNYSPYLNEYNLFDTTLSNVYNSEYVSHTFGTSYRYRKDKINMSAGLSYQLAQLNGDQIFPYAYSINKTFNSILPNLQLQYKFSKKKNIRFNYRSSNRAPSISQLQNVINNYNPLQLTTGNPDLKQDWQNSITIRYTTSNSDKATSFMALLSNSIIQDYMVNNSVIATSDSIIADGITLARGSQLTKPINIDGYFNVRSFNVYSFPLSKIKSNLSLNFGASYIKNPGMVNNQINFSNNYNAGLGFALSSNISERFDFIVSSNTTYNNTSNTLQAGLNSDYLNQNSKLKIQIMPWKWLVIQSDVNHLYNSGLSKTYNQNYLLWNAAVGYKFLKDKKAELRLSIFDILKQNNNISRNTVETYYEDIRTNVLQQYVLLTFSYNIKYYKDAKAVTEKSN